MKYQQVLNKPIVKNVLIMSIVIYKGEMIMGSTKYITSIGEVN